ncbi:MAG TPA: Ig-like domain-containing protein [Candidatus Saccharimonadales bacterium]|nr:Ig-like domain-containing protein [Candidatus Saccharimonadales bacterium]
MRKLLHFKKSSKNYAFLIIIVFILLAIPLTVRLVQQSEQVGKPSQAAATRDPLKQPFASNSIWNLPIGSNATRAKANLVYAAQGVFVDENVIIHSLNSPSTNIYGFDGDPWDSGISRCTPNSQVIATLPLPSMVVPGNNGSDGVTPNHSGAILYKNSAGKLYYHQSQPITHCTSGGPWTTKYVFSENNGSGSGNDAALDGPGRGGAQGGSDLSSVGGSIRVGELLPGASINHAVKIVLDSANYSKLNNGWRWPAFRGDGCAPGCYGAGANPDVRMGSLLALPANFDVNSFETVPGKILATAAKNYGLYIVDSVGPVWAFTVETGTNGNVKTEFKNTYGYDFGPWGRRGIAWERDIDKIMTNLDVITNWNQNLYNTVAASNGGQGAGGGSPLVAWAPDVCPTSPCGSGGGDTTNPTATLTAPASGATVSGTAVTFSANASDNVGVTQVQFFVNNQSVGTDSTSPYSIAWNSTTVNNGTYPVFAKAYDAAGNQGNSTSINITVNNAIQPPPPPPPPPPPTGGNSVTLTIGGNPSSGSPYSVVATTTVTGTVKIDFLVNGSLYHSESTAPYSMFDDNGTTPNTGKVGMSSYVLTVNVYQQGGTTILATAQQTITEGTSTKVGDVNGDGTVGSQDLSILISTWGSSTDLRADLNKDGKVSSSDLAILISKWGS